MDMNALTFGLALQIGKLFSEMFSDIFKHSFSFYHIRWFPEVARLQQLLFQPHIFLQNQQLREMVSLAVLIRQIRQVFFSQSLPYFNCSRLF